jgi:outer membrane protein OmpA-like peptidoglycan-associated protein
MLELGKERPQIDLNIYFNYNSAAITAKAEPQLKELGKALSDPRLENATILIGAHTDARGSDKYNQKLSERRAEAVRGYLVDKLKIPADNLSTAGCGNVTLRTKPIPLRPGIAECRSST